MDFSKPSPAEILPGMVQQASVNMGAQPIDFSKYEQAPPAAIDFSKYEKPAPTAEPSGFWDTLQREGKALTGTIAGMPAAVYHAFSEPATAEEKQEFGGEDQVSGAKRVGLGIHRLALAPVETAADWYSQAAKGKIPDAYEQALSVAPEAIGSAGGALIAGKLAEGAAKATPAVADTLTSPTKMTAPLRAVAPAVNAALKRVPGAVGTAAGYAAGRATGLPEAGVLGGGLGYALTKDIPMPRIPENIGLPSRVEGGPATLPPEAADATPPAARTLVPDPAAGKPEFSNVLQAKQNAPAVSAAATLPAARTIVPDPAAGKPEFPDVLQAKQNAPAATASPQAVEQALNQALGGKPLVRGVSLRNQPAAQAAAAVKLPEGFTPVDSSLLKGYKYDPTAREFTAVLKNGQSYTHGEVTPDQVAAFENADSQGSAWTQQIRNNSPLVRKNGMPVKTGTMQSETGEIIPKAQAGALPQGIVMDPTTDRPQFSYDVAAKPRATPAVAAATPAAGEDLTAILQKSLEQAKMKNAAGARAGVAPEPVATNASGESAASQEAINQARQRAGVPQSAYDEAIRQAAAEGPAWTPEKAQPVVSALNKNPDMEFEARGSVGEGRATSNDLDLYQKKGNLSDAASTLQNLGFKRVAKTAHGETWTNGAQHIDLWDSEHEPVKGYGGAIR